MSPEQIQAPGEVDHRADIYALGVMFYQMLTGELPGKKLEAPSSKVQIDVRLYAIVLRALEKNPNLRYQQVSQVKTMVETIVATPPGSSRRESAQTESAAHPPPHCEIPPTSSSKPLLHSQSIVIKILSGFWAGYCAYYCAGLTIAITGILAALLLVTVSQVKGRAQRIQCANNLRQLGVFLGRRGKPKPAIGK